jgi:hypothetical protein
MTVETKEMIRKRQIKRAIRTAILGALVAIVCRALPPEYQGPCETVIKICSGSF